MPAKPSSPAIARSDSLDVCQDIVGRAVVGVAGAGAEDIDYGAELFKKGTEYSAVQFAAQRHGLHGFAPRTAEIQRDRVATSGDPF
jgi:hypothetical protein